MRILVLHSGEEGERISKLVRELGHRAEWAPDFAEARAIIGARGVDVLIAEWNAPVSLAELRGPYILALSTRESVEAALDAGAHDCVCGALDRETLALRLAVARRAVGARLEVGDVRRTELELREALELNRRIMEAIPGGIVRVLGDGSIAAANPEALRVLGLSWDDLTRRYVTDFHTETLHEDGTPCPPEHYPVSLALSTGQPQAGHVIGVRRPDGQIAWAVFTAVPVRDPDSGNTAGAVVTFLDVTRLRELETKFQQTQKLESLGVLAGGVAHDFNNLLAAILGNASLARHQLPPGSAAIESLSAIETASQRAADLTAQMLAYSGRGRFLVRPLVLSDLVREMTELLSTVISKKATLATSFADALPPIEADPGQLQQVVMNLIVNASDALGDAPGTITIQTSVRHATREVLSRTYVDENLAEGDYVVLEVSDTGKGMDAETRARVFDPFFTTKATGRGLGLAATLGIVRGHRGAVDIETAPGRGTRFVVYFPAADAALTPRPSLRTPSPLPSSGEGTILIIDDEPMVLSATRQMLEAAGYTTLCASDGREGISLFERTPRIDVVVLDMTMPDMNGAEVLTELRRLRSDVRVLLCSGYSESEVVAQTGREGVCAFLQKPYSIPALVEKIELALSGPSSRDSSPR